MNALSDEGLGRLYTERLERAALDYAKKKVAIIPDVPVVADTLAANAAWEELKVAAANFAGRVLSRISHTGATK